MEPLTVDSFKKEIASKLNAENELKEFKERFYNLFEKAPIGILILDNFGKFIDANPKFTEIMGYDKKEFIGKNLLYLSKVLKSDLKKVIGQFSDIVKGKTLGPVEFSSVNNQGKKISILCTFSPILQQKKVILLVEDITLRKEIQNALEVSESSYRRLFETAKDGVLLLNADNGMIMDVNPYLIELLGYSKKAFLGKHIWEIGLFKDVFTNKKKFKELKNKKYVRYEDLPLKTSKGKRVEVEFVSNLYEVDNKKVIQCNIRDITLRKEIEERFYNLFEKVPMGILILDNFGKFIDANPKFTEIMGYDKKEFIGKNLLYLSKVLKSDLKKVIVQFGDIVKGKTLGPVEFTLVNSKGKKISILCTFSPILRQKNVILLVEDITDNKEIQDALQVSESSYRRLFETAKDGVLLLDAQTSMIMDVNPYLINLLGYSKKAFLGKHVWEIGLFKDVFANKEKFKELQSKKYVRYENLPLETGTGKKINVEFVSNVYYVGDKKVIQCSIRDITLRKEIQDALIKKEEESRTIFDTSPALIIILDNKGKVIKMNDKILAWLGYNKEEFIGKNLSSLPLTEESKIESINEFNKIMKGEKTEPYEVKFISKDNKLKIGLISGKSIIDTNGKVISYYATVSDINEKKELEELRNNLIMLTSHDLKQPLMPILGYADLLKTIVTEKKGKEYLDRIIESSYRMRDMTNKIINVFKIEAGQLLFTISSNDLSKTINEVIEYKTSFSTLKGIKIINKIKPGIKAMFDLERIRDVFVNLLDNAIKFTNKGGTITVKSWIKGRKAYSSVKDTGKGLNKEEMDNLFKKFYQSKEAKALGGSGIGLLLVKKIIDGHKGKITVKSVYGKGAEFIVELPRK